MGSDLNDYIRPLGGSDFIDGKKGTDTVFVFWPSSKFNIVTLQGTTYLDAVSGASRSDKLVLRNVEAIEFSDKVVSLEIADVYVSTASKDNFDGGPGVDTVTYAGKASEYIVKPDGTGIEVSSVNFSEGSDWLLSIERLQFKNSKLALDVANGPVADGAKLMGALLGPAFVKDKALAGIVIGLMDQNYSAEFVATLGLATPLYLGMAGSSSHVDFVKHVFTNVVGRQPLANELNQYVGMLENGSATQASLAVMAANTDLNAARIDLVGLIQHGWEFV